MKPRHDTLPATLGSCIAEVLAAVPEPTPDQATLLAQLHGLKERLQQSRIQIAVLGQFKRGKSTLLNALLEAPVLPTAVTPLTAIPTFIQAGTPALRLVRLSGETETITVPSVDVLPVELARYVTEEGNPENAQKLARVEINLESRILSNNLCFIDTPGIGSTFSHNSETAEATLPHCDAALFVVSPDPPITAAELDYLHQIKSTVGRLMIVLNKIDIVDDTDLEKAEAFLRNVLTRQAGLPNTIPVFRVAARAEFSGHKPPASSQLAQLKQLLADMRPADAESILSATGKIKIRNVIAQLLNSLEIQRRALQMPIAELEQRAARFDNTAAGLKEERKRAFDLLAGDRNRVLARIEADADTLRQNAREKLNMIMNQAISRGDEPHDVRDRTMDAVPSLFESELHIIGSSFSEYVATLLQSHMARIKQLTTSVTSATVEALGADLHHLDGSELMIQTHQPYWVTSGRFESLFPTGDFFDQFIPKCLRHARFRKRASAEIETVVSRNVENLRWATIRNTQETFDRFSQHLNQAIDGAISSVSSLLKTAKEAHQQDADSKSTQLGNLAKSQCRLLEVRQALAGI